MGAEDRCVGPEPEPVGRLILISSILSFPYARPKASPVVILIGVIGNSMTIIIMTRKRMRSSTNVYLAFLATVDMLYLTLTFILSLKHYPGVRNPTGLTRLYWRLTPIFMMLADACTNCSVWLTAAFTIEVGDFNFSLKQEPFFETLFIGF